MDIAPPALSPTALLRTPPPDGLGAQSASPQQVRGETWGWFMVTRGLIGLAGLKRSITSGFTHLVAAFIYESPRMPS